MESGETRCWEERTDGDVDGSKMSPDQSQPVERRLSTGSLEDVITPFSAWKGVPKQIKGLFLILKGPTSIERYLLCSLRHLFEII